MTEQHHIYHWKHGWIPLTHAAAMSKAKGNSKLADKYVPGASHHHAHIATHGMSAAQIHTKLAPHKHHSDAGQVAKLRDGDHALVHGMDEHGQPTSFAGTVHGVPTPVRIKQGSNGKVEHHFAVSMHNGSDRSGGDASARTTLYVKNPDAATPAAVSRAVDLPGSPAHVSAARTSQGRVKITDTIHGASFETNEGRLASALNQGHKVNGVTAGRLQTIGDDGAHHSFGPGMDDGRVEVKANDGLTIMQRAQRAESAKNPMNRMTDGTTWRETPKGLIAVRGNREVHLLGTSVNAQKQAKQMLAEHSFDKLFKDGRKAPGAKNVAFHKLEEHPLDRLDRHKAEGEAARANLTPGDTVKVAEGTHWHNIGMTGGELVKMGRTKAHIRHANGVTYQVDLRHVTPAAPTAKPAAPAVPRSSSPRATRGSAGERITSHGLGIDHRAEQKKRATDAGARSRATIVDEIQREHGNRDVGIAIANGATKGDVERQFRSQYGIAGMENVDVERADGPLSGWYADAPNSRRRMFLPDVATIDKALARGNMRAAEHKTVADKFGAASFEHAGETYGLHVSGDGNHAIVHNVRGGQQVGEVFAHPEGGFTIHSIGSKSDEPGYLPEHRVATMKQAIAGLHAASVMREDHRRNEAAKASTARATIEADTKAYQARETEKRDLVAKISADRSTRNKILREIKGTHEEQMNSLRTLHRTEIARRKREGEIHRSRADANRRALFDMSPPKASRTTRDTATMQASRDKLTTALERVPVDVHTVGEDGFAAMREGSAISVGGHVGHIIQKQGNDVLSYHPPTAEHRQGRYYRHTRRKGRNGLIETGSWESNARA